MSCTVLYEGDEREAVTFRITEYAVDGTDHCLYQVDVLPFVESADIIGFSILAFVEDQVNGTSMVFYIEPVADILSFPIDRKRFSMSDIIDKQWNKLFWKLIWTIIVRTVGYYCRKSVSVVKRADEMI